MVKETILQFVVTMHLKLQNIVEDINEMPNFHPFIYIWPQFFLDIVKKHELWLKHHHDLH